MSRVLRIFLAIAAIMVVSSSAHARAPINDVYVIHLILDGTNFMTMKRVIDQGKMPTLKNAVIDRGATFTTAISTFPSTSTSAYQSFVTGLLPGHAGIPHLQRFDRQHLRIVDYLSASGFTRINGDLINLKALQNPAVADLDAPSIIYELLDGYPTLALYTSIRRGAAVKEPETLPLRAAWSAYVSHRIENVDVLAYRQLMKHFAAPVDQIPRFTLVGLYSPDIAGHYNGMDSTAVEEMLIQFDYFLSDFLKLLERQGIRNKTYIIVSADHGMHDTGKLFLFREAAIDRGIAVKPKNPNLKDYTMYAADRGVSSTHVYTRRDDGTFEPLEHAAELTRFPLTDGSHVNLIDFIRSLEATELVIVRDGEQSVMVYDANGNASRISCLSLNADTWCSYHVVDGGDPLKFIGNNARQLMDGKPHASQEWKRATADEYYMDGVVQLGTLFKDGRGGDLFIVPKNVWGFRSVKKATHGSLIREDMHIPLFIAGPTVPHGTFGAMRTVDAFPLLVEWFGLDVPPANHDGVNPFAKHEPEDPYWQALATLEAQASSDPSELTKTARRISVRNRGALQKLAQAEMKQRTQLLARLKGYIAALERQQSDAHAPKAAQDAYVDDHLAIAKRIERLTVQRMQAMTAIAHELR